MKHLIRFLIVMLAVVAAGTAHAVTLTDLLGGGTITAGDKLFDRWSVISQDKSDGTTVNTDNITVSALNDGGMDPGPGLRFDILNNEFRVQGDDIYAYLDFMLGFRMSVLDPNLRIKDNSLDYAPFGALLSHAVDGSNDLGTYIMETIGTNAGLDDLGIKDIEFSILDEVLFSKLSDSATFAPQSQIWVTKNILIWAVDSTDTAELFGFEQRFSQTTAVIPEPATVALMAIGLAGLVAMRRRKN